MTTRFPSLAFTAFVSMLVVSLLGCGGGGTDETNASLGTLPAESGSDTVPREVGYVALGASDAVGIGASPLSEGYVFEIEEAIRAKGYQVNLTPLGVPGAEVDEIEDVYAGVGDRLGGDIDLVTLWTGSNDIVAGADPVRFEQELATLLGQIRADSSALIVIATVPDLPQLPRFVEMPDENVTEARVASFNDAIRRQAASAGAIVVETMSVPISSVLVSDDGFHPSSEGHERLAALFLSEIEPELPVISSPQL